MKITKVVDANGTTVGRLLAIVDGNPARNSIAVIELTVSNHAFYCNVSRDGFVESVNRPVYWESGTCGTGQGYFEFPLSNPDPDSMLTQIPLVIQLPGQTVYVPDFTVAPSVIDFANGSRSQECSCSSMGSETEEITVVPAIALVDLSELFEAPFSFA